MKGKLIARLARPVQKEVRLQAGFCVGELVGPYFVYRSEKFFFRRDPFATGRFDLAGDEVFAYECAGDAL